jgi:hypothetical protein
VEGTYIHLVKRLNKSGDKLKCLIYFHGIHMDRFTILIQYDSNMHGCKLQKLTNLAEFQTTEVNKGK